MKMRRNDSEAPCERRQKPRQDRKPREERKPAPKKVTEAPKVEVKAKPEPKVVKEEKVEKKAPKASVNYEAMTVAELKDIARENELVGYSTLRKAELIEFIKENLK